MILPFEDSIIEEKNKVQEKILSEANGDLREYTKIVHEEFKKMKEKYKDKFNLQSTVAH
jgi:hypothetical protein